MAAAMVASIHKGANVCEAIALKRYLSIPAAPQPPYKVMSKTIEPYLTGNEYARS
jgi:hypothetical protein